VVTRLDRVTVGLLREAAAADRRSMSGLVALAVNQWLVRRELLLSGDSGRAA
jgi:hypothetical protein